MFKGPVIFAVLAMAASSVLLGQDVFPRDGNEALAMRLHDWYVQSQAKLTNYQNELPRAERNAKQFVNLPGDHEDLDKLNQIKAEIEREQNWCNKIRSYWEKNRAVPPASAQSFSGRYGPLSTSSEKSTNPEYDKIEFAIRSFPFSVSQPDSGNNNQPTPGLYRGAGIWKLSNITPTSMDFAWWGTTDETPPQKNPSVVYGRGTARMVGGGLWKMTGRDQPGYAGGCVVEAEFRFTSPTTVVQGRTRWWKIGTARLPENQVSDGGPYERHLIKK